MIIEPGDAFILESLKRSLNERMTREAEPILQAALKEMEAAMRTELAKHLVAAIEGRIDMYRDGRSLMIRINNPENKKP